LFDPTDTRSARYNPLLEVRKGSAEVRDVQNIADILVDPEGALERRTHWEKTSHALLVGVILHVLYAEENKTLTRVTEILADPAQSFEKTLRIMMATNHLGTADAPKVHPVVAATARDEDACAACAAALCAARSALESLRHLDGPAGGLTAGIALHYGRVSYGNIGSGRRLDFTVIGPDVNLVSRIQTMCSTTGHALLMSRRFVAMLDGQHSYAIGRHKLRGFHDPVELYAAREGNSLP
jgi:class 3 adenylate cyclase